MTIYLVGSEEDHFIVDRLYESADDACHYCDEQNAFNRGRGNREWWVVKETETTSDHFQWKTIHSKYIRYLV